MKIVFHNVILQFRICQRIQGALAKGHVWVSYSRGRAFNARQRSWRAVMQAQGNRRLMWPFASAPVVLLQILSCSIFYVLQSEIQCILLHIDKTMNGHTWNCLTHADIIELMLMARSRSRHGHVLGAVPLSFFFLYQTSNKIFQIMSVPIAQLVKACSGVLYQAVMCSNTGNGYYLYLKKIVLLLRFS